MSIGLAERGKRHKQATIHKHGKCCKTQAELENLAGAEKKIESYNYSISKNTFTSAAAEPRKRLA